MGSLFYALVNGWYLGQWADYSSCLAAASDSQYILATVKGKYNGSITFTRGGIGKYSEGFSTRMGLCFPKQCSEDEVRGFTEDLIKSYAEGVNWEDVKVDYVRSSNYDIHQVDKLTNGALVFMIIMGLCWVMVIIGIVVE